MDEERAIWELGLAEIDRVLEGLVRAEEARQRNKIILIPSESLTPRAVREALGSAFTSIYAEGYPREEMLRLPEARLSDIAEQLAYFRRYSDRRFYKGVEFADLVEALACRRAAECFATAEVGADDIFANVQALSGAAANMAIYEALLRPGDTILAMDLTQGGHLSHGSPFHQSGRRYRVVAYGADPVSERLDYDRIMALAKEHRPRMIIAGYTSYPWAPDWRAFREIASACGAFLMADIAHVAGMAIAGAYPNPIGYADVIMFTTHKTLCGPRGAVILSCDPEIAARIDAAVFPGAQGGPHVNKFAAIACAFQLARTPAFRDLMHRIVDNARHLAHALAVRGLRLAYGGTDTHLLVLDLRGIATPNGEPLAGEIAARILDLVGIVANKNTIPGDTSAADARGIRYGTPWATQRGMGEAEMEEIAEVTRMVLTAIRPFTYHGAGGPLPRGKLPLPVLDEARQRVQALLARFGGVPVVVRADPPHRTAAAGKHVDLGDCVALLVRGGRAAHLLHEAGTASVLSLDPGHARRTLFLDGEGNVLSEAIVGRLPDDDLGRERFLVLAPPETGEALGRWLSALSDGYVLFDPADIYRKVQGPAAVDDLSAHGLRPAFLRDGKEGLALDGGGCILVVSGEEAGPARRRHPPEPFLGLSGEAKAIYARHPELFALGKPYFVGQHLFVAPAAKTSYRPQAPERPLQRTPLAEVHRALGARMAAFAGYEMPLWYTSALDEHRAVRERAALFDLGHMGVFEVAGRYAESFLNVVTTNYAGWLHPGQSQYGFLLAPDGEVIDDLLVYRTGKDRFLLVVNAANEGKDWDWLNAVNSGRVLLDPDRPWVEPDGPVDLRDLKAPGAADGRVDLALQGPASRAVLLRLLAGQDKHRLIALRRTEFREVTIDGASVLCARTGYTGEPVGYELLVPPSQAEEIWHLILDAGKGLGVVPCGLAARDSLRTEAGLPLYGHELGGEHRVWPHEAGFAPYVKLHKAFFVGRAAYLRALGRPSREVVRFAIDPGQRPVRAGAPVVDRTGHVVGTVTSCVVLENGQVGMALLDRRGVGEGTPLGFVIGDRELPREIRPGARLPLVVWGKTVSRFLKREALPMAGEE
ncbi:serine hydroxymethyltransferase [Candidatus Bipolaricaulota bacterium]|nr:serine hydroxymethyltransferase [Candidatus Bipolaricaulota bacterium]